MHSRLVRQDIKCFDSKANFARGFGGDVWGDLQFGGGVPESYGSSDTVIPSFCNSVRRMHDWPAEDV